MRKAIWILLLAGVNSSATAAWVKVGQDENVTTYVDPVTIRKTDNMVKMLALFNYTNKRFYASMKVQTEHNCKKYESRGLSLSYYSEKMGEGQMVNNESTHLEWAPVSPGSVDEALWEIACKKNKN